MLAMYFVLTAPESVETVQLSFPQDNIPPVRRYSQLTQLFCLQITNLECSIWVTIPCPDMVGKSVVRV